MSEEEYPPILNIDIVRGQTKEAMIAFKQQEKLDKQKLYENILAEINELIRVESACGEEGLV